MRKSTLLSLALILGGMGFAANAAEMNPATTTLPPNSYGYVLDGGYFAYPSMMVLTWDGQTVNYVEDVTPYFTLTNLSDAEATPEKKEGTTNIYTGLPYNSVKDGSTYVSLSLGYGFDNGSKYEVSLPAGIFVNENGETNPAQSFTFNVRPNFYGGLESSPVQSNVTPYPFYSAEDLSDVQFSFTDRNIEATGTGKIIAYKYDYVYDDPETYTGGHYEGVEYDLTESATVSNNAIHVDMSSLPSNYWTIAITEGFIKTTQVVNEVETVIGNGVSYAYYDIQDGSEFNGEDFKVTNPTLGSMLNSLASVTMTFGQPIRLVEDGPAVSVVNGEKTYECKPSISANSGNYSLVLSFSPALTDPGTYKFTIPAGFVTNGTYFNQEEEFEFRVTPYFPEDKVTKDPEPGIVSSSELATITLTFEGVTEIQAVEGGARPYYYEVDPGVKSEQKYMNYGEEINIEGNKVIITLSEIGQYQYNFTIPSSSLLIDDTYVCGYITANYTVWDGISAAEVVEGQTSGIAIPAGTLVLEWEGETVTATEDFGLTYKYYNQMAYSYVDEPVSASAVKLVNVSDPTSEEYNGIEIDLEAVFNEFLNNEYRSGNSCTLNIPAGIVENADGLVNPAQSYSYTVYQPVAGDVDFYESDVEGVYVMEWSDITYLNIGYQMYITVAPEDGEEFDLTCPSTYTYQEPLPGEFTKAYMDPEAFADPVIKMNLSELEDGVYTIKVPTGLVSMQQGEDRMTYLANPAYEFNVIIGEGVSGVKIENAVNDGRIVVYNLQGVKILDTVNAEDLGKLAKGLYIINGKQTMVRK